MADPTAATPRWRTITGKMLVVAPGQQPAQHDVIILYDAVNDAYGIVARGGDFKGYVFEVPREGFEAARATGQASDTLRLV